MDKFNRQKIRSLLQDDRFRAVEMLKKLIIQQYQEDQVKADTEFETLWRCAQREAKVEGLHEFFNKMIEEAAKSDD